MVINHEFRYTVSCDFNGRILSIDDLYCSFFGVRKTELLGARFSNFVRFPFGASKAFEDAIKIKKGEILESNGSCLFFFENFSFITTINKYALTINDEIYGIIYESNIGYDQIKSNPCLNAFTSIEYQGVIFSRRELQILLLINQFSSIKNHQLSHILDVKESSICMYKNKAKSKSSMFNIPIGKLLRQLFIPNDKERICSSIPYEHRYLHI